MRRFVLLAAFATASALGGCILFGIDDLSGGNAASIDDAETNDVGVQETSDAAPADASKLVDADAGFLGANFCAHHQSDAAIYCDDYDEGDGSADYLGSADQRGLLTLDTAQFQSPPRSMHCTRSVIALADAAGVQSSAHAQVATNTIASLVHVEFDFFAKPGGLPTAVDDPMASLFTINITNAGAIELLASSTALKVVESSQGMSQTVHTAVPYSINQSKWVHLVLILNLATAKISVTANSVPIYTALSSPITWTPGLILIKYGLDVNVGNESAADIYMDNVIVTTE